MEMGRINITIAVKSIRLAHLVRKLILRLVHRSLDIGCSMARWVNFFVTMKMQCMLGMNIIECLWYSFCIYFLNMKQYIHDIFLEWNMESAYIFPYCNDLPRWCFMYSYAYESFVTKLVENRHFGRGERGNDLEW